MKDQAMYNQKNQSGGWGLGLQWVLANTVGGFVGGLLGGFTVTMVWVVGGINWLRDGVAAVIVALSVNLFVGGVSVGIMQWLVLRRRICRAGWWVLATVLGIIIGVAVASAMVYPIGDAIFGVLRNDVFKILIGTLLGTVLGASVGIMQWFVLRRRVYRAGWWVLASTLGWVVGATTGIMAVVGITVGIITGFALAWLMRNPIPEISNPEQSIATHQETAPRRFF